jgi:prolyl-tRNA synthetase
VHEWHNDWGTVVETLSDDKGIIWPKSIAPFGVHLLVLGEDMEVRKEADSVYDMLLANKVEVLFDDREGLSPGEKFADADLLGIPMRLVVSNRSIKEGGIEAKARIKEKGEIVKKEDLISFLSNEELK